MRRLPCVRHSVLVRVRAVPLRSRIVDVYLRTAVQISLVEPYAVFVMALGIVQQYPACLIPYALQDLRVHRIVLQNGPAVLPVIEGRPGKLHHLCVGLLRAVHMVQGRHIHAVLDQNQRNRVIIGKGKAFGIVASGFGARRYHIHARVHAVQHSVLVGVQKISPQIKEILPVAPDNGTVRIFCVQPRDKIVVDHISPALAAGISPCHEGIISPVIYHIVGKIHNTLRLGISVVLIAPKAVVYGFRVPLLQSAHGMGPDAVAYDRPLYRQVIALPRGAVLVASVGEGAVIDHDIPAALDIEGIVLGLRLPVPEMDITDNHIFGGIQVKILPCQGNALPGRRLPGYSHVFNAFLICHRLIQPDGA